MSIELASTEARAPLAGIKPAWREALIALFFAGEMRRYQSEFRADDDDTEPVKGQTADALFRRELIRLRVASGRQSGRARYSITLTGRGLWFAETIIAEQQAVREALAAPPPAENAA